MHRAHILTVIKAEEPEVTKTEIIASFEIITELANTCNLANRKPANYFAYTQEHATYRKKTRRRWYFGA